MPTFLTGNLWDEWGRASLVLFTSNSSVKRNGCLVMGRGSAQEAQRYVPDFAQAAGSWLQVTKRVGNIYGLFLYGTDASGTSVLGAFQTKHDWRTPSTVGIIASSVRHLCALLVAHPQQFPSVAMPFPGIGAGGLSRETVLPVLEPLPPQVRIYEPRKESL